MQKSSWGVTYFKTSALICRLGPNCEVVIHAYYIMYVCIIKIDKHHSKKIVLGALYNMEEIKNVNSPFKIFL